MTAGRCAAAVLAGALVALVAANTASLVASDTLCCADDANSALAARNLAIGKGYTHSYSPLATRAGELVPFDPNITMGPTLVLPVAAAVAVFGPRYWVPGAVTAGITFALLLAAVVAWRPLFDDAAHALAAGALWLAIVQIASIGRLEQWYAMLGEVPASLLVIVSTAVLARDPGSPRQAAAAGLLFGLAVECKLVAALAIAAPLAALARAPCASVRERLRPAAAFALSALALPAAWSLVRLAALGPEGFAELLRAQRHFVATHPGAGAAGLDAGAATWLATARANLAALDRILAVPLGGAATVALGIALLAATAARAPRANRLAFPLALAAAGHAAWWLLVAPEGRARYLLPAFLYGALPLAVVALRLPRRPAAWAACALALFVFAGRLALLPSWPAPRPWFAPSPRAAAMLDTAAFLERLPQPRTLVADWWGTAVDLEYLLPGAASFTPVWHFDPARAPNAHVVRNENLLAPRFEPEASARLDAAIARCGARRVFQDRHYSVWACGAERE
jgi:hypothetical protein